MDINLITVTPIYKLFCKYFEYLLNLNNEEKSNLVIIKKQSEYVCIDNKIAVYYITKFENLENDLKFIMEKFNFEGNLPKLNVNLSYEKYVIPDKYLLLIKFALH